MLAGTKTFVGNLWGLSAPYWRSSERRGSGVLLGAVIALNLSGVGLSVVFNNWNKYFYNALSDKDFDAFRYQLFRFFWLSVATIVVAVSQTYLRQLLLIRWRRWLTADFIDGWLRRRAYYRMQLTHSTTDNPDQRIADDIGGFITLTLNLSLDLLTAFVTLASFAAILWTLSGPATAFGIAVPGYMLWVALLFSLSGTWLVTKIGWPLVPLIFHQQQVEAEFRFSLVRVRENAEGIALYAGEDQEGQTLGHRFGDVVANFRAIMNRQYRLNWFSTGFAQSAIVVPFIVASPLYFSGAITLGVLMQTASAFSTVQAATSWLVVAFGSVADWTARLNRLSGFQSSLRDLDQLDENGLVERRASASPDIIVEDLNVWLPDGAPLLEGLSIRLPEGSRTLISGESGSGKSTLFRVLAGLWPYCDGVLTFPDKERLLFLPQKPYLPIGALRSVAAYPDRAEIHPDRKIRDALGACGLGHLIDRLDENRHWGQILSGGEQQRLALARALIVEPRWLFMDEATSNLDEVAEAELYAMVVKRLSKTALVSISHHQALLARFHDTHFAMSRGGRDAAADLEFL